jgi:phosphoglycerol transferase MdoB-like AlkP superfamily enzyme
MDFLRRFTGPLGIILSFFIVMLAVLLLSRFGLMVWQWDRVVAANGIWPILLGGLRMDLMVLAQLTLLPAIVTPFFSSDTRLSRVWRYLLAVWLTFWLVVFVVLEVASPSFILEYDTRPDRLFVEYLQHPKEILSMLIGGFKLPVLAAFIATLIVSYYGWRFFSTQVNCSFDWGVTRKVIASVLVLLLLFLAARSSLQHRPANPSSVAFSGDRMVNTLPLSSAYNVLYAIYGLKDESDASAVYGKMDTDKMISIVHKAMPEGTVFEDGEVPTLHQQLASISRDKPLNLVIIVEESLGADAVGHLGGKPLTPELDELTKQGWWFDNLYATGTRSVRGLEAITTGFLPTPARAVVKLGKSQRGFFTLAELLGRHGFKSRFMYGGESHFDNMKGFFLGNGFDEVIDQPLMADAQFVGSWGVSDEDLFEEVHKTLLADSDSDQPRFTLVFSTSNHTPYEFPDGVELYEQPKATVNNAVKYADYALGAFFDQAKQADYWENTVFVIVADHDARVFGASLVPIEGFHIPAIILGADVQPRKDTRLVSQVDLAPTLLSIMGLDTTHPMLGRDLTQEYAGWPGRAIMQYGSNQAYREGDDVVILQADQPASQYRYSNRTLISVEVDPSLLDKALAHAQWASWAYANRRYRLEPQ